MKAHVRRARNAAFYAGFAAYAAGVAVWLSVGLLPALAGWMPMLRHLLVGWAQGQGWLADAAQRVVVASGQADTPVRVVLEYGFSFVNVAVGLMLVRARPRDVVVRLLAWGMIGTAATFNHQAHAVFRFDLLGNIGLLGDLHTAFHVTSGVAYMWALALFPDGRLDSWATKEIRSPLRAVAGLVTLQIIVASSGGRALGHPGQSSFVAFFGLAIPLVGVVGQTLKLRRATTEGEHQQCRLVRMALVPMLAAGIAFAVLPLDESVGLVVFPVLFALVPAALIVGIFRYRLWEVEVALTAAVAVVVGWAIIPPYLIAMVVVAERLPVAILPTVLGLPAIYLLWLQSPLRPRVEAVIDRLLLGERAGLYETMTGFATQLAGALSQEQLLSQMAEAAGAATGASRAQVSVTMPRGGTHRVGWPPVQPTRVFDRTVPVVHQGAIVGEISVARPAGQTLTAAESRMLDDLALQAGPALANVRLGIELESAAADAAAHTRELRASRRRLVRAGVTAQIQLEQAIDERVTSRLEDVGRELARIDAVARDRQGVLAHLDQAARFGGEALDAVRDLARGLFPPLLRDRGLAVALEAAAGGVGRSVAVEIDPEVARARFDPRLEAGVYFCLEAAARAASARAAGPTTVRLALDDSSITFSVEGRPPGGSALVPARELEGLADRIEALGGSLEVTTGRGRTTEVSGRVPAQRVVSAGAPSSKP